MAIVNRDKDASEQKLEFHTALGAVATGSTLPIMHIPYPCQLLDARMSVVGTSGSPTGNIEIHRFIVGTGITQITGQWQAALALQAVGTSGPQRASLAASTSATLLLLQTNDVVVYKSGGANSSITAGALTVVLQSLQDVKTLFGL